MSEYQYYEFQTIDRRLTDKEMAYLRTLSSRVNLSASSAIFVYNWGDFRGDPAKVLEKYFDAMLYLTNWGTRQLIFRFPKDAVDADALRAYELDHAIIVQTSAQHLVLDFQVHKEESEWIDSGEGWLSKLAPLRESILRGDFRAVYLAWLRVVELELGFALRGDDDGASDGESDYADDFLGISADTLEPPVPPGLDKLSVPLQTFVEFFEISDGIIVAGAEASAPSAQVSEPIEQWVNRLSEQECKQFLLRVARGEPNMDVQLVKHLRERFGEKPFPAPSGKRRTIKTLLSLAQAHEKRIKEEQRRQAECERVRRLKALAEKEPQLWNQVRALISQKKAKEYDEAVKHLKELRELAEYQQRSDEFAARIKQIREDFPTLSGLKSRLLDAGLIERLR
jgi:hypothetical protein